MGETAPVEIVFFPKMCCGQPVVVVKKFSGSGFMECRVTGESPEVCKSSRVVDSQPRK